MTHTEAIQNNLAEKYLLSELPEREREDFELHFFSCRACAADLNDGAVFIENARSLLEGRASRAAETAGRPWWSRMFPQAARPAFALLSAALVVVSATSIYQRTELTAYRQPRQVPEFTLLAARRGPAQTFSIPRGAREAQLLLDAGSDDPFASFRCEFRGAAGDVRFSVPLRPAQPGKPMQLLVPASLLTPGEYRIHVFGVRPGAQDTELAAYPIQIRPQENP